MQPKQPPWPTVSLGVSVRGLRYLGTSSCFSAVHQLEEERQAGDEANHGDQPRLLMVALDEFGGILEVVDLGGVVNVGAAGLLMEPFAEPFAPLPP